MTECTCNKRIVKNLTFGFFPCTSLEAAGGVDKEEIIGKRSQHILNTILNLLRRRHARRMNIVYTRSNLVLVPVQSECSQQLHITLGHLDRDNIRIETLDRRENVVEV